MLLAAAACAGCAPGHTGLFDRIEQAPRRLGREAGDVREVALRYRRAEGQHLRYDTAFRVRSRGEVQVDDDVRVVVYQECLGRTGPDPEKDFDKVAISWREVERRRREVLKNGQPRFITAVRWRYPPITGAFQVERRDGQEVQYFGMDDQGRFAVNPKVSQHTIAADTLLHFLPVLPRKAVRVGESWETSLPVYIGPVWTHNEERLRATMRLAGLYRHEGRLLAFIDFEHAFRFDSQEHRERFNDNYNANSRLVQAARGSGRAVFEVEAGRILYLSGEAEITRQMKQQHVTRGEERGRVRPRWNERWSVETLAYHLRLMDENEPLPMPTQAGRE